MDRSAGINAKVPSAGVSDAVGNFNRILYEELARWSTVKVPIKPGTQVTTFNGGVLTTASWTSSKKAPWWTAFDAMQTTRAIKRWCLTDPDRQNNAIDTTTRSPSISGSMKFKITGVRRVQFHIVNSHEGPFIAGYRFHEYTLPMADCTSVIDKFRAEVESLGLTSVFPKGAADSVAVNGVTMRMLLEPGGGSRPPSDLTVGEFLSLAREISRELTLYGKCKAGWMQINDRYGEQIGYVELTPGRSIRPDVNSGFNSSIWATSGNGTFA